MALGIFNAETIKGIILIAIIIWVFSGGAGKIIAKLIRDATGGSS